MDMKDIDTTWINLMIAGAVAIGFAWTQVKTIPKLADKVDSHEVQIAVMRNDLTYIKQGVETLVRARPVARFRSDDNAR